ncbi:MAG TPA: beta-N-acetylhexosaminidase [Candidatus Elarobacter sp.]|jgi:beta-N-acetylhexosaminidase|nr:beta-N-acetylhexosaminidase [Candidatus Elarobacter sp.]
MPVLTDAHSLARGVLCVGFHGSTAAEAPLDELRALQPGGITLFARNAGTYEEVRALITALRATGDPPPLITVDQEGGRVERLRDGVAALPSAMAVGATGDVALARRLGALVGRDLARLGVSVDLAPVADLALHHDSRVIGTRAYGDDPERVAAFTGAFARGLEGAGAAAVLKHFPGHGSTGDDSHVGLPHVTVDEATLRARDLVPFARAIAAGDASIVLTAHVVVEALDPQRPATLSRAILTGLLRGELGFEGVIATDCLEMDAIAAGIGTVEGAVASLAAGADLLLISHHLDLARAAADAIAAAVEDGRLPFARLHDAHARVRALRERLAAAPPAADEDDDENAPLEAAQRAVTSLAGDPRLRPGRAVTVISFEGTIADHAARSGAPARTYEAPSLSGALRRRGWKSELMRVPLEPAAEDLELLLEHVTALGDREFVVMTRDAHLAPAQQRAVARILDAAPDALVVSARTPFDARLWPAARRVVCLYGDSAIAFEGAADVLSGRAAPRGTLPVRLNGAPAVR